MSKIDEFVDAQKRAKETQLVLKLDKGYAEVYISKEGEPEFYIGHGRSTGLLAFSGHHMNIQDADRLRDWLNKIFEGYEKNKKDLRLHADPEPRENRHRRKAGNKPWRIEYRRVKSAYRPCSLDWFETRYGDKAWEWREYSRYETKRARDEALRNLVKKTKGDSWYNKHYEYRIPPEEEKS